MHLSTLLSWNITPGADTDKYLELTLSNVWRSLSLIEHWEGGSASGGLLTVSMLFRLLRFVKTSPSALISFLLVLSSLRLLLNVWGLSTSSMGFCCDCCCTSSSEHELKYVSSSLTSSMIGSRADSIFFLNLARLFDLLLFLTVHQSSKSSLQWWIWLFSISSGVISMTKLRSPLFWNNGIGLD